MSNLDDILNRNRSRNASENYEFYEDTHDEYGEYTQQLLDNTKKVREEAFQPEPEPELEESAEQSVSISKVMAYEPKTVENAQEVIDYVIKREPIIVNLDDCDGEVAQRVLDFVSGAVYALGGTVKRVSTNVFLVVPQKVRVILGEVKG